LKVYFEYRSQQLFSLSITFLALFNHFKFSA
jgi:hypothetical protein